MFSGHKLFSLFFKWLDAATHAYMVDHINRTSHIARSKMALKATVISTTKASDNVKALSLKIADPHNVVFKAGQWVDFHIPGVSTVGGFSICSPPSKLLMNGLLDLAVKSSDHEPAEWVHTKCRLGDEIELKIGGDVYYDPPDNSKEAKSLILVAGGIGITPLSSIIQHASDLHRLQQQCPGEVTAPDSLTLLYSAKTTDELLFKKMFTGLQDEWKNFKVRYFVTGDGDSTGGAEGGGTDDAHIEHRRINRGDIAAVCQDNTDACVYVCGPPSMIDDLEKIFLENDIPKERVLMEKWS